MKQLLIFAILSVVFLSGCTSQTEKSMKEGEHMTENTSEVMTKTPSEAMEKTAYAGKIIAGNVTKYIRFNQDDYQKALSEDKVIYFYFYANWCPICREERPKVLAAFNELNYPNVVGFEVHFNDNEVTPDDERIAKQLGISYQHTSVIHVVGIDKTGKETFRSISPVSKDTIKQKIADLV